MKETLTELKDICNNCTACGLSAERTNVVFGVGNPTAEIMLIGEGPGENEDLQGQPFVGRGGQLLDKILDALDLSRKTNIYIANMVKCRPPQNRDPKPEEIESCIGYLRKQVTIIKPKIIVCLGRVAACNIIDKNFKVTKQHGEWIERGDYLIMGTFHPAALLRNPNNKPLCFDDFIKVKEKIDEISTTDLYK